MTKPKELIARWPLNKNFNLEGCNCITTCHAKIVTFEIALECSKIVGKYLDIFGNVQKSSANCQNVQKPLGRKVTEFSRYNFLVCSHVTTEGGHVGSQYNRFFLE